MMGLFEGNLIGNIGREPELHYTKAGKPVLGFSVGVNRRYKDQTGKYVDSVAWIEVAVFGPLAESLSSRLSRGTGVFVSGDLSQEFWKNKDGENRAKIVMKARTVRIMSGTAGRQDEDEPPIMSVGGDDAPY